MPLIALTIWPFVAMALMRSLGRVQGIIWAILVGALFLPEAYSFDLPGLPPLDKEMAILLGVLFGIWVTRPKRTERPQQTGSEDQLAKVIILGLPILLLISAVVTVLNNTDIVVDGPTVIKGLDMRDLIAMLARSVVLIGPFLIAQRYLSDPEAHVMLMRAFVLAGLAYSLLILFEARMSPQLHTWVYGYFQHTWKQHIRGGAYRPIVFLKHGLVVGVLLLICAMSAFILLRGRLGDAASRKKYFFSGFWFFGILILSRNFGATLVAFAFLPLLWFIGPRFQTWIAVGVMSIFLVFPAMRQTQVLTFERTLDMVGQVSVERQQSLAHRIENEDRFLARLSAKPVTGWGIWGRWRVRDPITGEDISTSDGRWMSVLGERGWLGFISYFGMMMAPVFLLLRARKRRDLPLETTGIAMILSAIVVYQIANNTIGALTMVFAGALAGFVWRPAAAQSPEAQGSPAQASDRHQYTRFPPKEPLDRATSIRQPHTRKALS